MSAKLEARISSAQIQDTYNTISHVYDLWAALTESKARELALSLAAIRNGEKILEVAVGTGIAFRKIVEQNPDGFCGGIDLSPGMLRQARKRMQTVPGNFEIRQAPAGEIPYPDQHFDLLFCNYMFDLLPEQEMAPTLLEFRRVLRPGGRAVIANMAPGRSILSKVYPALYRISPRLMGGCRPVSLESLLVETGYTVDARHYLEQFAFPSEVISARLEAAE